MRFLSVAQRELRGAARQRGTYRARWLTATAFLVFLVWLIWVFDGFRRGGVSGRVFTVYAYAIHFYCLIIGTALTADCISSEKREGTLGLLFLTNLSSLEIIIGKVCSRALAVLYGVVAIFPMLAITFLMGGITLEHFWKTVLSLIVTLLFSVAAGFLASVLTARQFTAIGFAFAFAMIFGAGLMAAADVASSFKRTLWLVPWLSVPCPLYSLATADGSTVFGSNQYWLSLIAALGVSALWIGFVVFRLRTVWRDRPKAARAQSRIVERWQQWRSVGRAKVRRRSLSINPFFWLGARQRVTGPIFMLVMVAAVLVTELVTGPFFTKTFRGAGALVPLIGHIFAWLWTGLALHVALLYYVALTSSRRLAEDKQTGALELILSTPTDERVIAGGLWLAFARRMFFPAVVMFLVHFYFVWQGATLVVIDPPAPMPVVLSPGKLIWSVLFNQGVLGPRLDWQLRIMLEVVMLFFVLMVCAWFTVAWVGRWLGLRLKHAGFAPLIALALLIAPPIMLFTFEIFLFDKFRIFRLPERQLLPLMLWSAFFIGIGHCTILSFWARHQLRYNFRSTVTSHFQPPVARRWLPRRRTVVRFTGFALSGAAAIALLVGIFYGYQNWRTRRAWTSFQTQLKQKGESLDLTALKVVVIPEVENFARATAFSELVRNGAKTNLGAKLERLKGYNTMGSAYGIPQQLTSWVRQDYMGLDEFVGVLNLKTNKNGGTNVSEYAVALLRGLEPYDAELRALSAAARRPHFQISTNTSVLTVLNPPRPPIETLERLHLIFELRACAGLEVGRTNEAGGDLLTSIRLAQRAREIHDAESAIRVQMMITRSLQPLWEGLARHQWTEAQLSEVQRQLSTFKLLNDYTNNVRHVMLAYVDVWRERATSSVTQKSSPIERGAFIDREGWQLQPRAWWLEIGMQMYRAGDGAIAKVDFANQRMSTEVDWTEVSGLPVGNQTQELLQQSPWLRENPVLVSYAQTSVNQAIVACALERYYLKQGKYPEALEELMPTYFARVPIDVLRGRPIIYQQTNTTYILRGVGPNLQDDRKQTSSDDWLWWYGTNPPPAVIQFKSP